jgi:hypothetical protein
MFAYLAILECLGDFGIPQVQRFRCLDVQRQDMLLVWCKERIAIAQALGCQVPCKGRCFGVGRRFWG